MPLPPPFTDWQNALMCARFSKYAYLSPSQITTIFQGSWKLKFYEDPATETQAYMAYVPEVKTAVLVFRGSQELGDWIRNIIGAGMVQLEGDTKAVAGFWESWQAVAGTIKADLASLIAGWGGPAAVKIYVTGHSLGGAVASLATFDLVRSTLSQVPDGRVAMYNFGSPAVGNPALVNAYAALRPKVASDRFIDPNDLVPKMLEVSQGYANVPVEVALSAVPVDSAHAITNYIDRIMVDGGIPQQLSLQITTANSIFSGTDDRVSVAFNQNNKFQILSRSVEHLDPFEYGYVDTFQSPDQLDLAFLGLQSSEAPTRIVLDKVEITMSGDWNFTHVTVRWNGTTLYDKAVNVTLNSMNKQWWAYLGSSLPQAGPGPVPRSGLDPSVPFEVAAALLPDALHLFSVTDSGGLRRLSTTSFGPNTEWDEEIYESVLIADYQPRVAAAPDGSRIDVFVRDGYGTIYQSTWRPGSWSDPVPLAMQSDTPLSVVSSAPGRFDALYLAQGRCFYGHCENDQWGPWQDISGTRATYFLPDMEPGLARTPDGSLLAAARIHRTEVSTDGTLCGATSPDGVTWTDWATLVEMFDGPLSIGSTRAETAVALKVMSGNGLYFYFLNPTGADGFRSAGGMLAGLQDPVAGGASIVYSGAQNLVAPGDLAAFVVRQADGVVLYSVYTDPGTKWGGAYPDPRTGWTDWQPVPGLGPIASSASAAPAAASPGSREAA